ncbi:hypothetical protein BDW02DRAFT_649098 [Decorospora gaudefroyi]|uniref:Uncharacterized protein n=1 Tax=Decorospora gaudefroyi TaxID=184978 RepID=A0A6A5K1U5_9PLEO|nr:hypothetical protein BDW02DRAFT_649734 [Decorospora gaudefroyi]KAF1832515.1 hypothetical protein BDW02DRAFT_649098 [Decorospora gaudefroyi]
MDNDYVYHNATALERRASNIGVAVSRLSNELQSHIALYSKAECLSLYETIQQKLPRELRDMICTFALPHKTVPVRPRDQDCLGYETTLPTTWISDLRDGNYEHLLDSDYVGTETKREMAEEWYRVTKFRIDACVYQELLVEATTSPAVLTDFLNHDRWGFGIDVRKQIRNVCIYFCCEETRPPDFTDLPAQLQCIATITSAKVNLKLLFASHTIGNFSIFSGLPILEDVPDLNAEMENFRSGFPVMEEFLGRGRKLECGGRSLYECVW